MIDRSLPPLQICLDFIRHHAHLLYSVLQLRQRAPQLRGPVPHVVAVVDIDAHTISWVADTLAVCHHTSPCAWCFFYTGLPKQELTATYKTGHAWEKMNIFCWKNAPCPGQAIKVETALKSSTGPRHIPAQSFFIRQAYQHQCINLVAMHLKSAHRVNIIRRNARRIHWRSAEGGVGRRHISIAGTPNHRKLLVSFLIGRHECSPFEKYLARFVVACRFKPGRLG